MEKDYRLLFSRMNRQEPPAGLLDAVMARIEKDERRRLILHFAFFGTVSAAALAGVFFAWHQLISEAAQSGFSSYISLLFSDAGLLAVYWQDFVFSLAESLPLIGLSALFASVFALLFSLRHIFRDINILSYLEHGSKPIKI
jgi:hypothetical protein